MSEWNVADSELAEYMDAAAKAAEVYGPMAETAEERDLVLTMGVELIMGLRRAHPNFSSREQVGRMLAEIIGFNPFTRAGEK